MARIRIIKLFLAVMLTVIIPGKTFGTNTLYVQDAAAGPGKSVTVSVGVNNSDTFSALQFDLVFPSVLTWTTDAVRLTSRAQGHSFSASLIEPGRLRIVAWSFANASFTGSSGAVVEIDFKTGDAPGGYPITLGNATLGGASGNILSGTTSGTFTLQSPSISLSSTLISWGRVPILSESFQTLTITNTGNLDLNVSKLDFADIRFTTPVTVPFTLSAGTSIQISIRFYSAVKGTISSRLIINSNDPSGTKNCDLSGVAFAVNEIHIGTATGRSGYEVTLPVTINNMEPMTAFQIKIKLPVNARFVRGSESLSLSRKIDHILVADTTRGILTIVAYSPANKSFLLNEGEVLTFKLFTEGQGGRYALEYQEPVISGTDGQNSLSATYSGWVEIAAPVLSVSTSVLDFGNVSSLETNSKDLVIYNNGNDNLIVTQISVGDNAFKHNATLPFTLTPGQNKVIAITFGATDGLSHQATLRIRSNDTPRDPTDVTLKAKSFFPNELRIPDMTAVTGMLDTLYLELFNQLQSSGFQFDIEFPAGTLPSPASVFLTNRKADHMFIASALTETKLRVLSYSFSLKPFSGASGYVLGIPFRVTATTEGTYPITISGVEISDLAGKSIVTGSKSGNILISYLSQSITLTAGWNIISFAVQPPDMSLKNMLSPLIADGTLLKVQDEKGAAIEKLPEPIGWINNIGTMKLPEGYKIKVTTGSARTFSGLPVTLPYTISLDAGWNIIGYPLLTAQPALNAFSQLVSSGTLLKAQDEKGNAIEKLPDPIGWIDNIKTLSQGKGYKVKVSAASSLLLNNASKGLSDYETVNTESPVHFSKVWNGNGLDQMNIYITNPTHEGKRVEAGDEIAVFDGVSCVGTVVIDDPQREYFMITASLDDPVTNERDGFIPGNKLELRLWDGKSGEEKVAGQTEFSKGYDKLFIKSGTTVLSANFEGDAGTLPADAYPNPSAEKTTFTFRLEKEAVISLEIYDMRGETVKTLVNEKMPEGRHSVEWDNESDGGAKVKPGIYFYRLKMNEFVVTKKLIII
jgi:hypothetical protein